MEPRPAPKPAHSNANERRGEGDRPVDRKHQDDRKAFPENEGLTKQQTRETTPTDIENAKALEEAAQRGRTA